MAGRGRVNVVSLRDWNSAPFDLGLALSLTLIGSTLAWTLAGGIPAIGIDDAAVTRSQAENLAAGHGYVYNVGGEWGEGATSLA